MQPGRAAVVDRRLYRLAAPDIEVQQFFKSCLIPELASDGLACRLDEEVLRFRNYVTPTVKEHLHRKSLYRAVRDVIHQKVDPQLQISCFGSSKTGVNTAVSDIDIRLSFASQEDKNSDSAQAPRHKTRKQLLSKLLTIKSALSRDPIRFDQIALLHARYPLISMRDRNTGINVQIVLANQSERSVIAVKKLQGRYHLLKSIYLLLKTTLDCRGLTDVYKGGIGSYPLLMMIAAVFTHDPQTEMNGRGEALLNVLHFWGHFDTTKYGLLVDPPMHFVKGTRSIMSQHTREKTPLVCPLLAASV